MGDFLCFWLFNADCLPQIKLCLCKNVSFLSIHYLLFILLSVFISDNFKKGNCNEEKLYYKCSFNTINVLGNKY